MPEALIFDFDGVIADTETLVARLWQEEYARHGLEFPVARWVRSNVGTVPGTPGYLDEFEELQRLVGRPLDREEVWARRRALRDQLLETLAPRPGILGWIDEARRHGVRLAVASSSSREWVAGNLARLGLADVFECLSCADEVGAAKPDPAVYRHALDSLGVEAAGAVAVEDSPPGVEAAKAAGLFCVAVPGPLTRHLTFDAADLVVLLPDVCTSGRGHQPRWIHSSRWGRSVPIVVSRP